MPDNIDPSVANAPGYVDRELGEWRGAIHVERGAPGERKGGDLGEGIPPIDRTADTRSFGRAGPTDIVCHINDAVTVDGGKGSLRGSGVNIHRRVPRVSAIVGTREPDRCAESRVCHVDVTRRRIDDECLFILATTLSDHSRVIPDNGITLQHPTSEAKCGIAIPQTR